MAGHSKWANIKRHKSVVDAKRGQVFTKLIREITIAARMGGADASTNPRLRIAIDKAKAQSMPKDNIERAIKKGTGELESTALDEILYEGFGPGGVAIIVASTTDNKNRTVSEVRLAFSKNGGNLGDNGCVSWMFQKKGVIRIEKTQVNEEQLFEKTLDAGVEDIKLEGQHFIVQTPVENYAAVLEALQNNNIAIADSNLEMLANTNVAVSNPEQAKSLLSLIEMLEDNDDVQNVWSNADISDELLANL